MQNKKERFTSLDVLRGITVCFMIIVNTPGSGARPFSVLQHAQWHGFTPTDLVFPTFLFAVGNAMSFAQRRLREAENRQFFEKIIKRSITIFLIGYLMYWFPFFSYSSQDGFNLNPIANTRILGVLQRIALCYFCVSILIRHFSKNTIYYMSAFFLLAYWVLLYAFGEANDPLGIAHNAGTLLDKYVIGESHMYHGEGIAFDPEGILSTLPSLVNVVAGYFAGQFVQQKGKNYECIARLCLTGCLLIVLALCWNTVFPINKKLWTSSFVLLTSGIDLVVLAALVYLIELKNYSRGALSSFFIVFGKNALFIYVLSEVLITICYLVSIGSDENLYQWVSLNVYQYIAPGAVGSLLFALSYMIICWLCGLFLFKKNIYIHV